MLKFSEIAVERPTLAALAARYDTINAALDRSATARALADWNALRQETESWHSMVGLRFQQNTADPTAKAERDYADELAPEVTQFEVAMKRRLLADPDRAGVEALVGAHALRLWETDIATFEPAIKDDLEQEAKIAGRYTELLATARIAIGGRIVNLAGIEPYAQSLDRATRHTAERLRWEFFAAHGEALDTIYDQLVKLRHGMAQKLGFATYTPLGYRLMRRVDYGPEEVARYRDEIAKHVVPLVARVLAQRPAQFGYEGLHAWDEAVDDPAGNPGPAGDHDFLVAAAERLFDGIDPRLADFYRIMRDGGFLDLKNRDGKAGGGFCTSFPTAGVPFIFANFNGTDHDVTVFTHEMGHAFQNWESRDLPLVDYLWPTSESAEINSMGLEYLTYPGIGTLVGEAAADRFRRAHMMSSLRFLPYGVCVDHFQHEVYARPEATPAERHEMWQNLERRYLPWRDYGDLRLRGEGRPMAGEAAYLPDALLYIDYTLAECCALQFWVKSRHDYAAALADYVALCGRGGSAPFQTLVRDAGCWRRPSHRARLPAWSARRHLSSALILVALILAAPGFRRAARSRARRSRRRSVRRCSIASPATPGIGPIRCRPTRRAGRGSMR